MNLELQPQPITLRAVRREWPLLVNAATAVFFLTIGQGWLADLGQPVWFLFILSWLFVVILLAAFSVVHHAESLAILLGEPLGTLILTLSVIGIEVMMISAIMLAGPGNAGLARDSMFAVIMIVMNGMVGLSLLLGGLRHHEQTYNLQGANAYLAVIVPLAVLGLVLPDFTRSTPGPTFSVPQSVFLTVMSIGLYGVFLSIQTHIHRDYFVAPPSEKPGPTHGDHDEHDVHSRFFHALLLLGYLVAVIVLSKKLAVPIDYGIREFDAPPAFGGLLVALLILSPELLTAAKAARANQLQRSVNISLGSVLATISLTIPAVLTVGIFTGQTVELGLEPVDLILLTLTLAVSMITFNSARTNILLGAVHLLLFLAYLMLIFEQ